MARSRSRHSKTRRTSRANPHGVISIASEGYGFVQTAEGEFFIPASRTADAFDGDIVEVCKVPSSQAGRPQARVVRVHQRAHETVVGRYEVAEPFGVVIPADPRIKHDIFTLRSDSPHVKDGDIVRVRMTVYPSRREPAQGVVEEILGREGDAGVDVDALIARHGLQVHFSAEALEQAQAITVAIPEALRAGAVDLRGRCVCTIDPDDAKDFDDALSFDHVNGLYRLGVHIADVSSYVPWDSPIDKEARLRTTSVYLVDRVIPMLPERLCNDVCSLVAGQDRRCITVDLWFDPCDMSLVHTQIFPSVICSRARLSYGQVLLALEQRNPMYLTPVSEDCRVQVMEVVLGCDRVARSLHEQAVSRGALDFQSIEARVRLDGDGQAVGVDLRTKNRATMLVEECMIAANEAVARFLQKAGAVSIYRVHEPASVADLKGLAPVLAELGLGRAADLDAFAHGSLQAIRQVLDAVLGRPEEYLVSSLLVRSMKRAVYSERCEGHFGLASEAYTHFTSPIRRYPDLMVHRAIRRVLLGRTSVTSAVEHATPAIAAACTKGERTAEEASRQSQELKLYQLLEQRQGQDEEGIICAVVPAGFYVRLADTAEGFVDLADKGEYFILDSVRRTLTGADSATRFRIGMRVRVRISRVYPLERRAEFKLLG